MSEPISPEQKERMTNSLENMMLKAMDDQQKEIVIQTQRAQTAEQNAATDTLTGTLSRRFILEHLSIALSEIGRNMGNRLAVIYLDLDNFKQINDTYGHTQGDQVLKDFVTAIKKEMRSTDSIARDSSQTNNTEGERVGRLGGEEFIVLLPLGKKTTNEEINNILIRYMNDIHTVRRANKESTNQDMLTASLGCVVINNGSYTPEDILTKVDQAMYSSKQDGRNRATITFLTDGNQSPPETILGPD